MEVVYATPGFLKPSFQTSSQAMQQLRRWNSSSSLLICLMGGLSSIRRVKFSPTLAAPLRSRLIGSLQRSSWQTRNHVASDIYTRFAAGRGSRKPYWHIPRIIIHVMCLFTKESIDAPVCFLSCRQLHSNRHPVFCVAVFLEKVTEKIQLYEKTSLTPHPTSIQSAKKRVSDPTRPRLSKSCFCGLLQKASQSESLSNPLNISAL